MQIGISVRHGELGAGTREKLIEKVQRLRRYVDRINAILITVDLEHQDDPVVELQVSIERREDVVAKGQGGNVLAALDAALHKAEQQLRKVKERTIDGHRGGGHKTLESTSGPPEQT